MNSSTSELIIQAAINFVSQHRSLMLATILAPSASPKLPSLPNPGALPHASHVPFALDESGDLLILVSELSKHTNSLLSQPYISAMIIENEKGLAGDENTDNTQDPFARVRLMLDGTASVIARDRESYGESIKRLRLRLGETVDVLTQLPDFHLLRINITSATFVRGFAQAHPMDTTIIRGVLESAASRSVST